MKDITLFIAVVFLSLIGAAIAKAQGPVCGPHGEQCVVSFLSEIPKEIEIAPLGCWHHGQQKVLHLPAEWGCKNPVNNPDQPSWCYCNNGYEAAEAEFRAALSKALPRSIPAARFDAVMGTMTETEKQESLALRDWYSCGHTVDLLLCLHGLSQFCSSQ